ncbi:hypothetical protein ACFSVJ_29255 [Prauserella oleivorans]
MHALLDFARDSHRIGEDAHASLSEELDAVEPLFLDALSGEGELDLKEAYGLPDRIGPIRLPRTLNSPRRPGSAARSSASGNWRCGSPPEPTTTPPPWPWPWVWASTSSRRSRRWPRSSRSSTWATPAP